MNMLLVGLAVSTGLVTGVLAWLDNVPLWQVFTVGVCMACLVLVVSWGVMYLDSARNVNVRRSG